MTKVLVLITSSINSSDRSFCRDIEKYNLAGWGGCWWKNELDIPLKFDDHEISIAHFLGGGDNDIYEVINGNRMKENSAPNESEGVKFYLLSNEENTKNIIEENSIFKSQRYVWVILRKENERIINYIKKRARGGNIELLIGEHSRKETTYIRYTSTADYWKEMMRLRYLSIKRNVNISRKKAFEKVWLRLDDMAKENRFRTLKHDLAHLFSDLKADIEGWVDDGFTHSYAKEIEERYSELEINKRFAEAKKILYGNDESILSIVEERELQDIDQWRQVQNNILPSESEYYPESWMVLKQLVRGNIKQAKQKYCKKKSFSSWVRRLDRNLEEVRSKLLNEMN